MNIIPTILVNIRGGSVNSVMSDSPVKVITLDGDIQDDVDMIESQLFGRFRPFYEDSIVDPKTVREILKLIKGLI